MQTCNSYCGIQFKRIKANILEIKFLNFGLAINLELSHVAFEVSVIWALEDEKPKSNHFLFGNFYHRNSTHVNITFSKTRLAKRSRNIHETKKSFFLTTITIKIILFYKTAKFNLSTLKNLLRHYVNSHLRHVICSFILSKLGFK